MSRRSGEESGAPHGPAPDLGTTQGRGTDAEGVVRTLSPSEFHAIALRSPGPVLVDFHAEWCAPCKWLDPILEEVAPQVAGRIIVGKLDVDEAPELARRFSIRSVPCVLLFVGGKEVERSVGVEPERIRRMVGLGPPRVDEARSEPPSSSD
jgi:thioredoxin 1